MRRSLSRIKKSKNIALKASATIMTGPKSRKETSRQLRKNSPAKRRRTC